jgi:acetyl-CoA C-acetyltransferase
MKDVYIAQALRTPIGGFQKGLSSLTAAELGATVIKEIIARQALDPAHIQLCVMGQVLQAGHGMNPGRQAAINAGLPNTAPAYTVNQVCGSGMRAVMDAALQIAAGYADLAMAGGMESMSRAPHVAELRQGQKFGDVTLKDSMLLDGLWDIFNDYHMGVTAENLAEKNKITREAQDEFSAKSQEKAHKAQAQGKFDDEIVPVTVKSRKENVVIDKDESIRADTTVQTLAALKPAFKKDGTVTAGNASTLNDGAAALLLASEDALKQHKLAPLARIVSFGQAGVDPAIMGEGPIPASQLALEKAGWKTGDLQLVESNEAFAVQSLSVLQKLDIDADIVNVNGGAIALGHPIGCSGARVLVTLLHEMHRRGAHKGLATLCIGGGMGIATTVEAV